MIKHKIILIPFPFDDLSGMKVRPALCLTEPIGFHRHVIVAFITSQIPSLILETDIIVRKTVAGFAETGLKVDSTISLHRLMTITTSLINRELGSIPNQIQPEIEIKLLKLFAIVR